MFVGYEEQSADCKSSEDLARGEGFLIGVSIAITVVVLVTSIKILTKIIRYNWSMCYICIKESPWAKTKSKVATHPDAVEIGDQIDGRPDGGLQTYECPNCGVTWTEELEQ